MYVEEEAFLVTIAICAVIFAASPFSLPAASVNPAPEPVRYTLATEMVGDAVTALRIEVRFHADPSGTTQFEWDDGWAGERKLWQWARDFNVAGASAVERNGDGHWRIKAAPGAQLAATYRIISAYDHDPTVEDSDQPRPVIRPGWFYAVGNALFAYPTKQEDAPAMFDWTSPSAIHFASDLEHPPVRRIDLERHAAPRDYRDAPARQAVECIEQVLCRAPPTAEFGDQDRIDMARLGQLHHFGTRRAVGLHPQGSFAEDLDHLIAATFGKTG